ncbi:ABC transporter ATP-binding protein [Anaerocolumna sp. MB42-C2]|uniref:ABC transporter ATP-binding protein n=1 Tax=Anaerocolumna sp. MB42-C2 TaxID=3070997 RepID=UPI0027E01621|nr:ATP-binding cassette domain-containing protein [Anaerocolumna sp. MB42-C2]WMJ86656.1 ATP-binding cassette domain-containing protein [Anaerocolumna sp. MB42-C2]
MIIELQHVGKTFKQAVKKPGLAGALKHIMTQEYSYKEAVKDVNIDISEGEAVAYVGPNGAGKSTTIKMMAGILHPTTGTIKVCGMEPYKKRVENAKNIGVVFGQRTQLWWDIPIQETYTLLRDVYELSEHQYKKQLDMLTTLLDMGDFMHLPARKLSLGQRMRADLAAALIHNPKILYLDEPTIGLDIVVKKRIRNFLRELNKENHTTLLLTTHDLEDIEDICDRIVIIDKGSLVYDGGLNEMKDKYARERALVLETTGPVSDAKVRLKNFSEVRSEDLGDNRIKLYFDRFEIRAAQLLNAFSQDYEIVDFKIDEPKIETVIMKMYAGKLQE